MDWQGNVCHNDRQASQRGHSKTSSSSCTVLHSPESLCQQVGGSLTGLFHGVVLKRAGHNVRILERANPDGLREQGAGITARGEVQEFFSKYDRFSDQSYFVPGDPKVQFINVDAQVTRTWKLPLCMTSWDTLYYRLRANFDGLESGYVTIAQRKPELGVGSVSYEYGCNVTDVKYSDELVKVEFERSAGVGTAQASLEVEDH